MRIDEILATKRPVFSFEFFPPRKPGGIETLRETIETLKPLEPDFVSVTYGAGGATREGTVELAGEIKNELGIETMGHLSCVGEPVEMLREMLAKFEAQGIQNLFALRGDPPRGEVEFRPAPGGFTSSPQLVTLAFEHFDFAIGGACFPEVHPEAASPEADLAFLKTKVEAGASFLITQLFFDNALYFNFVAAARAVGIDVPIIAGLMPITSYAQIRRFCDLCGASIPSPLAAAMEALDGNEQAEFELGVAYAAQQAAELLAAGAPGLHFYTINRAPATRAVLGALRAARPWERVPGGSTALTTPSVQAAE